MKFLYGHILFFLLIISSDFLPQVKSQSIIDRSDGIDIHLNFNSEPYVVKNEEGKKVFEFTKAIDEGKPGVPILPTKTILVAIPPNSKINAVLTGKEESTIPNVDIMFNPDIKLKEEKNEKKINYEKSEPALKYFVNDIYPQNEIEVVGYTWIRGYYCAVVQINTHRYNWKKKEIIELAGINLNINFTGIKPFTMNTESKGKFDGILSKVIINYKSADQYRSFQSNSALSDTSGNWIDYSKEYVKLGISEDGIYKITYDDLVNYGIGPSSVNPLTLKIFFKGKEIPLFVSGENDNSFDENDYIEFLAEKNYGSTNYLEIVPERTDYKNYYDRYNDTSFVWLTWGGENGLRADSISNVIPALTDSVKNHFVKLHLEKDERLWYYDAVAPRVQIPDWQENKVWTWGVLGTGGSSSFNFDSPDFVPNTPVKTITRLISNAADISTNAHANAASLNSSTPEDTIFYNFRQTVNLESEFNSNILNQTDNVYTVFGLQTGASFQQSLIDWVDIDFFRSNVAINDSLMITIPDSATALERVVAATNISDPENIYIYKVKPQLKRITAYNISSGTLTFTDNVSGGDKYLFIQDQDKKSPRFVTKKRFVNLRNSERAADYIILTNKELEESVNEYRNFMESNYQVKAEVVYINDIYDEFSFGLDRAEAVRDFLYSANQYWQSPKPSYLNIIGDANYDYKKIVNPPTGVIRKNLVPSYGNPVSDTWFVMWDSSAAEIPQMFVGRIPATNNEDVLFYLQKHQTYVNRQFDSWNKNYLFFSGGDASAPSQLLQIKEANDRLLNELVRPKPVGGSGIHFYKTDNPSSNFGPFSLTEVNSVISEGGLFISYIGHSGTQTWDNGIISTKDLKNIYADRNPLISDFGCSTGKFAEPDVDAFGELFLLNPDGQAINYFGNSSWGYLSTSLRFPYLFYNNLLIDEASSVGEAHILAKVEQLEESGFTDVNRVFTYCNFLFGDPIIHLRTPPKPNLIVKESSFFLAGANPNDMTDSVSLHVEIMNAGRVPDDSVTVSIVDNWNNNVLYSSELKIPFPLFRDTLTVNIPVKGKVGQHRVNVELDNQNLIVELYETDNSADFTLTVFSTSVRPVETEKYYNSDRNSLRVLNPVQAPSSNDLRLSISDNPDFQNATDIYKSMDSVYTSVYLNSLATNKRYWWRVKLNDASQEWSDVYSFKNANKNFTWFVDKSFKQNDVEYSNSKFDSLKNYWLLTKNENLLQISSAGSDDGGFGSILYNGQEKLPTTYYWGITTAEIDSITLEPSNFRYFTYSDGGGADAQMKTYLDSLPVGKIVAMVICTDGAQSVLGFSSGTQIRHTIEEFGSLYIDSVMYKDSWCMIGKKGATPGTVSESFMKRYFGSTKVSSSNATNNTNGYVVFPIAGRSSGWVNIQRQDSIPAGSSIEYFPIAIKSDEEVDTLNALTFSNNISSLANIDASVYPSLKILAKLNANEQLESPSINSLGINFEALPELGINYQVVNVEKDTLLIGEDMKLSFGVYNVAQTSTDSFKILVEVLNSNNEREVVSDIPVDQLAALSHKFFNVALNTQNYPGQNNIVITVDSGSKIPELFEDNNFYQVPFYVKPDTTTPTVNITFDGVDIMDGDYISSNPEIKVELFDQSLLPVTDPSSVAIFLNDVEINLDSSVLTYEYNSANPKMVVTYKPVLNSGEYSLKVFAKNASGNVVDSSGVEKYFIVNEDTKILYVYSYPNPSNGETYFTFKLTQIPDELKIKIFTVAGRLIKEIIKSSLELNFDFNRIFWDCKDTDGNSIANGTYLYKIIISRDGKQEDVTQKLAVVR